MLVAVTGGTGFIGSHLVRRLLAEGCRVRLLSREGSAQHGAGGPVEVWQGDLLQPDAFMLARFLDGVDTLIHCAGQLRKTEIMQRLHVDGTRALAEAAAGRIRRWVQLSSVGVYGPARDGRIRESAPVRPIGPYETTKQKSDEVVARFAAVHAFQCVMLRPSNVYGADMPNQSLFALIRMIDRGRFFYIGPPGASANYVHVDNVVQALMLCATHPAADRKIYNISQVATMERFVEVIADALGKAAPRLRLPEGVTRAAAALCQRVPGFPLTVSRVDALTSRAAYCTERIETELGYRLAVSIEDGLRQLVRAYRDDYRREVRSSSKEC